MLRFIFSTQGQCLIWQKEKKNPGKEKIQREIKNRKTKMKENERKISSSIVYLVIICIKKKKKKKKKRVYLNFYNVAYIYVDFFPKRDFIKQFLA